MRKIIRLTESDLARIVKRVIKEQQEEEVLYGPDGKIEDFCKTQRETLRKLLRNSEVPSECTIGDDEDLCGMAAIRIAGKMNLSGNYPNRINLNTAKDAGYALFKCNKENEPKRGPQVSKPKNPLKIGSEEQKNVG
jgi:hypothetical protein